VSSALTSWLEVVRARVLDELVLDRCWSAGSIGYP